ncbi:MAG: helix-turn-helix transcriptional regulator [Erythrobacter sp.]|nr:helix-turn-helix transcriptional regulator [Erythrobacter sp.]
MKSRNAEIFERLTQKVRECPREPITLDQAAREEGLSASRLHQIFAEEQGENFGAFIRRARVEYACGLMRAFKEWSCTQIAYEAGFSESSDFSRSFKRHFGIAPSAWDRFVPLGKRMSVLKNRIAPDER